MVNLEDIILPGIILGTAGFMFNVLGPYTDYVSAKRKREEQKKFVEKFNLVKSYDLNYVEELALHRISILSSIAFTPQYRSSYDNEDIMPIVEEYIPQMGEQSRYFRDDIKETEAFQDFLKDPRTKKWLTDPLFVMSDTEYKEKTSFINQLKYIYSKVYANIRNLQFSPREQAIREILNNSAGGGRF